MKNIYYLAPLASFFVEPFVWSCDIANQQNRSQVGENSYNYQRLTLLFTLTENEISSKRGLLKQIEHFNTKLRTKANVLDTYKVIYHD